VLENGKAQILDVTAFSMVDWLLKENGDGAAPCVSREFDVCLLLHAKVRENDELDLGLLF